MGAQNFCPKKYALKINKMPEYYMILARKIIKIPEFLWYLPGPALANRRPCSYFPPPFSLFQPPFCSSPSLPFPSPSPPRRGPLPFLLATSSPSASCFPTPLSISVRSRTPYGVWGSAVSSLAGSGAEPQPKSNLMHFSFKMWLLVATILIIFLIINWPIKLCRFVPNFHDTFCVAGVPLNASAP